MDFLYIVQWLRYKNTRLETDVSLFSDRGLVLIFILVSNGMQGALCSPCWLGNLQDLSSIHRPNDAIRLHGCYQRPAQAKSNAKIEPKPGLRIVEYRLIQYAVALGIMFQKRMNFWKRRE
jgi:hypothetical protein